MKLTRYLVALALTSTTAAVVSAQEAKPAPTAAANDAETSDWKAVLDASRPPLPPSEWNNKKPTDEEYAAFRKKMGESAAIAADKAKEFAEKYPQSKKAAEAQEIRLGMLQAAVQLGVADREQELSKLAGSSKRTGPAAKDADPFMQKMQAAVARATELQEKGMEAMLLEFEKGVREVMKEYPDRPEVYVALLQIADGLGGDKAKAIGKEIADSSAPEEIKKMAAAQLKKLDVLGKPLEMAFTAVDGRKVDVAELKGKVVLIDFWATWCGPCVAELPKVKAAYDKLNSQGFEIVGISFDQDQEALESFVKKKAMAWPQFFDGSGWQNKFGQQFGIQGIPTMWLLDKQGIVRDLNAREDLTGKVEKLLAEK